MNHETDQAARARRRGLSGRAGDVRRVPAVLRLSTSPRPTNGIEALEKTHRADAGHHPDGSGAAGDGRLGGDAAAKADERTRHIPIVALTGHALAGHAEGARQAGCDAFVTKPCLPDALVAEIQRMLAARSDRC